WYCAPTAPGGGVPQSTTRGSPAVPPVPPPEPSASPPVLEPSASTAPVLPVSPAPVSAGAEVTPGEPPSSPQPGTPPRADRTQTIAIVRAEDRPATRTMSIVRPYHDASTGESRGPCPGLHAEVRRGAGPHSCYRPAMRDTLRLRSHLALLACLPALASACQEPPTSSTAAAD